MIIAHGNDQALLERYQQWRAAGAKPVQWEEPEFEMEVFHGGNGFILYTWHREKTAFELEDRTYVHLRYSASVNFYVTSTPRHMDQTAFARRYRSDDHANTRFFDLMWEAYERWWNAGRPADFRYIA